MHSFGWLNSGQPKIIKVLEPDRITEVDIRKFASDFIAEFFARLPKRE
jgi:hypothetical protein